MSKIVGSYVYCDARGKPLARIDRIEPGWSGRSKEFLPFLGDGRGGYCERPGLSGVKLPLYHLDEVLAAIASGEIIYLVEGEGKADKLRAVLRSKGSAAAITTVQGGANAPMRPEHIASLARAKKVIVLGDSDEAGRRTMRSRAQRIADAYATCTVCMIDLYPDRTDGSDVADWLAEGHTPDELRALAAAAPRIAAAITDLIDKVVPQKRTVRLVPVTEIAPIETRYIIEPYVPRGEATWLEGMTKTGKTMVWTDLVARLTRSDVLPPTGARIERGRAVILTCEDSPERTIVPRLIAAGADLNLVSIVRVEEEGTESIPSFVRDADALERELSASQAALLVVDGTFGVLGVEDGHSYTEAYQRMLPLVAMVRRLDIGAIIVRHVRKTEGVALNRGIGSVGYASLARSTVSVAFDREDEAGARRLWAHAGSNVGETGPTLSFTIVGLRVEGLSRPVGRVVWGDIVAVTADEAMREARAPDDRSALDAACDFLNDLLGDGAVKSLDVCAAADRARISRATLRRAATKLGVERRRAGERGPWLMILPDTVHAQNDRTCSPEDLEHVRPAISTYARREDPDGLFAYAATVRLKDGTPLIAEEP